ncbi:synaptonemal complex protein 2-like [Ascaphus truei]|uniref:synaptonemal complex protein 2-like n=1 Tax=Ascaphus truei TaxID=8439 RepID=UPI003F59C95D
MPTLYELNSHMGFWEVQKESIHLIYLLSPQEEESQHLSSETSENVDIQTEFCLETLISDAFKGKGFQKITEFFQDKVACTPQRYSRVLLNQLDRLINKELDRNEFKHVSLLLKCIQHFCKIKYQECSTLIQQGLVAKMVLWFERSIEFLNIAGATDSSISVLVEDFYDTALVICKCNCEEGKKQLLDSFLFRLGLIVTEKWAACHLRLEALRTLNCILDNISREDKKRLNTSEEMCVLTQDLARTILEAGDYDIQVAISEALCRIMMKKWRDNFAHRLFVDSFLAEAFKDIKDKDFETDCRKFLNFLNSRLQDKRMVYTFPCITVFADMDELSKPQDDKLDKFWIDFNVGSQSVSFYINNKAGCLWDSIRLVKDAINNYSLQELDGQTVCNLYLKKPLTVNNKEITKIKIYFEQEHDIQHALNKVFGEDLNRIHFSPLFPELQAPVGFILFYTIPSFFFPHPVLTTDTTFKQWKSDQANMSKAESASDILGSQISEQSSTAKISSGTASTNKSVITTDSQEVFIDAVPLAAVITITEEHKPATFTPVEQDIPSDDVILQDIADHSVLPPEDLMHRKQSKTISSPNNQSGDAKKSRDSFEFQCSSDSLINDSVSEQAKKKVLLQKSSSTRVSDVSKLIYSQMKPEVRQPQSANYKKHLFSESNGVASNTHSERSWILDFQKKSSSKSADYSRRKHRSKSKLKVLPLSSASSDDEGQLKNRGSISRFTTLKGRRQEGGKAKNLTSSQLKLPGISALLTPGDSNLLSSSMFLQFETAIPLSDLDDKDLMDPLEDSSPGYPRPIENPPKHPSKVSNNLHESGISREGPKIKHSRDHPDIILGDATRKSKHSSHETSEEIILKPRKLFSSSEKKRKRAGSAVCNSPPRSAIEDLTSFFFVFLAVSSGVLDEDVFYLEPCEEDLGETSVVSAFENFTKDLKHKFLSRYKRMEIRAQRALETSHQQVSTLFNQIHQCRLHKLQHFDNIVVQELSSLETEAQALKGLEKEALDFWEEQSKKMNSFCNNQKQRIESMDSAFEETMSSLASVMQKTEMEGQKISHIEESMHTALMK